MRDGEALARDARALRGAATMARQEPLAALAGALERVAAAVRDGRLPWTPGVAESATAAVDAWRVLLWALRTWTPSETAAAAARTAELDALLVPGAARAATPTRGGRVVPIRTLAPDDGRPQLVHRAPSPPASADLRFRQAAVPIASALRRLIAEAREVVERAPVGADGREAGARATIGADLRAAIVDLRELAESYDIGPVVGFAAAREGGLAALDPRTLDVVDGAAAALIESAGAAWARPTPPAMAAVPPAAAPPAAPVPSPAPPAAPAPEPETTAEPATILAEESAAAAPGGPVAPGGPGATAAAGYRPPTGPALVELLETGIAGIAALDDQARPPTPTDPLVAVAGPPPADGEGGAGAVVPIDALLYRGPAALARARAVRDALRRTPGAPDPALLAELYDLLDLVAP